MEAPIAVMNLGKSLGYEKTHDLTHFVWTDAVLELVHRLLCRGIRSFEEELATVLVLVAVNASNDVGSSLHCCGWCGYPCPLFRLK